MPAPRVASPTSSARRHVGSARVAAALAATLACAILATTATWGAQPLVATASAATRPPIAILVLAPYLSFDDLSPSATPALWRLAENGSVGAINARTGDSGQPNAVSGALTISAGRWASVEPGTPATAADVEALQAAQAGSLSRPVLGSLGEAIRTAGGRTGALSIILPEAAASRPRQLPAELAAMDTHGAIDTDLMTRRAGTAGAGTALDSAGQGQPFKVDLSYSVPLAVNHALRPLESSSGPGLLVVDSPALTAASESSTLTVEQAKIAHAAAVWELDKTVSILLANAPGYATLMVVSPATSKAWYKDPDLGVAIVSGPGFRGDLTSSSTHRTELVTTLDVAPTILSALGIERPTTMVGTEMTSRPSSTPLSEKFAALSSADVATGIVDQLREAWFIRAFVVFALLTVALALWALSRVTRDVMRSRTARAVAVAEIVALLAAAIPPAAWLMFLGAAHPQSLAAALGAFGGAVVVVLAGLLGVRWYAARHRQRRDPLAGAMAAAFAVSTLTAGIILADQWLGDPLRTGLFSYSVRSGWRFYGMGNEGAALAVGASLIAIGLAVEGLRDTRWDTLARRVGVPAVGAVVLVTTAAPFAGANAGAAIWGVVAYAVAWVSLNRIRMSLKAIATTAALVAVAVGALVAIDMATAAGGSTHLARFAGGILSGDMASTAELVRRKLANNLGYFTTTAYTLLFLALGGVFVLLRPASSSGLRAALGPLPAIRAVLFGAFVGGLVALATEDSSSVMPALLWFAALMPALAVALANSMRESRTSS